MSQRVAPTNHVPVVDGDMLRAAMRHVPSTVTVVTVGGEEPRGITIASFTSASLEPPLVSFNVQRHARFFPLIERAARYAVHVLPAGLAHLSDRFADPDLDRHQQFDGVAHRVGAGGLPLIEGMLAVFECEPYAVHEAGDHALFVGRVVRVESVEEGDPVLYYHRSYRSVGREVARRA